MDGKDSGSSRREFMHRAAVAGVGLTAFSIGRAHAEGAAPLRAGLVGCGRRGVGAVRDLFAADKNVTLVAMGDLFPDMLADARQKLEPMKDRYAVTDATAFSGWDAFKGVIAAEVDIVLLATPPGFRPLHLRAAVEAGKHVFMEKPVATDPAGIRSILESAKIADKKKLSVVAGTQRRHQNVYRDILQRVHDGAIGDIVAAECYWIGDYDYYTPTPRQESWSDMEAQLRNWNYYTWLSGDHIVEQHVHNIDIMNWALGGHPVKAIGMGGRQQRTGPEFGHIFDHFTIEFEYENGVRVSSLCRQMAGTASRVAERLVGTKGVATPNKGIEGEAKYRFRGEENNPYVQEHADLIAAIRSGNPLNEARTVAESTMAAIIGRMAAYTGQEVEWEWAMKHSKLDLTPPAYEFGPLPTPPVAVPGEGTLI